MSFSQSFDNLSVDPEGYASEKSDPVGECYSHFVSLPRSSAREINES